MAEENKVPTITAPLEGIEPIPKVVAKPEIIAKPEIAVKVQENKVNKVDAKLHSAAAPFKLISAGRVETKPLLIMLVYGDFGVGKTLLSSTAQDVPEMKDVLYIEADGGDKIINDREDITEVKNVRDYSTVARIYEFLKKHCYYRDRNDKENLIRIESMFSDRKIIEPKKFNTVVIDTLNEIQKYCMYKILGIKMDDWKLDAEPISPQYQDWGKDLDMVRWLVRSFRDLPMNTIFICSRKEDQDEFKRMFRAPNLPGKLANEVQGFLDHIGYYISSIGDDKKTHRRIYFEPSRTYQAKNRWKHWEGIYLDDPTMADIYNLEKEEQNFKQRKKG